MMTIAAPPSVVPITMCSFTGDTAISVIRIPAALMYSKFLVFEAIARTFSMRTFGNFHVLRGILLNGDVFLDALVIHSKSDCDQDQEGQEKTCAAMKHAGEVYLLFRMI